MEEPDSKDVGGARNSKTFIVSEAPLEITRTPKGPLAATRDSEETGRPRRPKEQREGARRSQEESKSRLLGITWDY